MAVYSVKGRTILDNTKIDAGFIREEDAIAYIKKLGAQQGVNAQIVKIEEGCKYKYAYNPDREKIIRILDDNGISYEIDDYLNIKISF